MQATLDGAHADSELLAFVRRLERNPYGWRAVHLHLSQLKPHHRRDYQLRVAASEFDALLRRQTSELFQLPSGDIVFIWEGGSVDEVDQVVLRLRYLFSDDPLVGASEAQPELDAAPEDDDLSGPAPGFCSWFDLEHDYDGFRYRLEDLVESLQEQGLPTAPPAAGRPLDPAGLARLEANLAGTDIAGLVRRQPVCAILPKMPPQPIFRELYVAIDELAALLLPGTDLTADTWLFQRLAESLDRRLLATLVQQPERAAQEAISVNLRLATLLSPEFLRFDAELRPRAAGQIVVELQLIDIYAEFGAYLFMREFIRERGYRICIDGLHHLHLPLINRKRLGADLVKLVWSPDLLDEVSETRHEQLEATIKQTGVDRLILCRCDSADAIRWGQSLGIRLFQGRYVDSRLRAARSPAVAAARKALRTNGKP